VRPASPSLAQLTATTTYRDATQKIDSYAAYAELTAAIMPRWQATLGLRYSEDQKSQHARYDGVGFPGTVASFVERSDANSS